VSDEARRELQESAMRDARVVMRDAYRKLEWSGDAAKARGPEGTSKDKATSITHIISMRDLCLPRLGPPERLALLEQVWSRRAVNRSVNAPTTEKRSVRGVDDHVDLGRSAGRPKVTHRQCLAPKLGHKCKCIMRSRRWCDNTREGVDGGCMSVARPQN
jgi:hypothetical protein